MRIHWKLKAHTLAVLSRVPAGRRVYHRLQRLGRTTNLAVDESLRRSFEVIALARDAGMDPAAGGTWLEVGTGWRPFLPFILYLLGAERVITLDVNPWLTARYAFETFVALEGQLDRLAAEMGTSAGAVRIRYHTARCRATRLPELLRVCNIEYRCPGDAGATGLADGSVDVVCSSNVLEHIPPSELDRIHRESLRILRDGGLVVHRFNPADHFSHFDSRITSANFLRYSARQWRWYGGTGLAYHNRLRCCEHEQLFRQAGFAIDVSRVRMDQKALEAIASGTLRVHPDFAGFLAEELAADYMWIVGAKAAAPRPVARPAMAQGCPAGSAL
ncbi:MAG TPA: class I SAM-dependent methyltransferase [Tepidisphaeraceae bacterium]|jgi:SAM-dependent methyltransferase